MILRSCICRTDLCSPNDVAFLVLSVRVQGMSVVCFVEGL